MIALAFIGWRTVMTLVFYEHPDELKALGYLGDERKVYKRLPMLVPLAEESGVRLRGEGSSEEDVDVDVDVDKVA